MGWHGKKSRYVSSAQCFPDHAVSQDAHDNVRWHGMERDLSHRPVWRACLPGLLQHWRIAWRHPTNDDQGWRGFSVFNQISEMGQQGIQHAVLSAVLPHRSCSGSSTIATWLWTVPVAILGQSSVRRGSRLYTEHQLCRTRSELIGNCLHSRKDLPLRASMTCFGSVPERDFPSIVPNLTVIGLSSSLIKSVEV